MDIPAERKALIASLLKDKSEAENKVFTLNSALKDYFQPALVAFTGNHNVEYTDATEYANLNGIGGPVFAVSFEYSDGDSGSATIPAHIVYAEDRFAAVAEYREAKKVREAAEMTARNEAARLRKYQDAGLTPEEINTVESIRIRLGVNGYSL